MVSRAVATRIQERFFTHGSIFQSGIPQKKTGLIQTGLRNQALRRDQSQARIFLKS